MGEGGCSSLQVRYEKWGGGGAVCFKSDTKSGGGGGVQFASGPIRKVGGGGGGCSLLQVRYEKWGPLFGAQQIRYR